MTMLTLHEIMCRKGAPGFARREITKSYTDADGVTVARAFEVLDYPDKSTARSPSYSPPAPTSWEAGTAEDMTALIDRLIAGEVEGVGRNLAARAEAERAAEEAAKKRAAEEAAQAAAYAAEAEEAARNAKKAREEELDTLASKVAEKIKKAK